MSSFNWQKNSTHSQAFSSVVDENYLVIGSHVEPILQLKIINNEYVDFLRLIPKHGGGAPRYDDNRMELVSGAGYTYFVPVSECETANIGNFDKWEQAFRVFSNSYTQVHPHRASELVQYNHIITLHHVLIPGTTCTHMTVSFRTHLSHFLIETGE